MTGGDNICLLSMAEAEEQRRHAAEVEHRLTEAQLEPERVDANAMAVLVAKLEIVTENHTIFDSLECCMIECECRERICRDIEFAELCEDIKGELAEVEASGFAAMPWIRPATNDEEAGPSGEE